MTPRKLQDADSSYAEMMRLQKAIQLAGFIKQNYSVTQELIDSLPTQSAEWWAATAKRAGVNPPSPATVEACCGLLVQELQPEKDAFSGLPNWDDKQLRYQEQVRRLHEAKPA